MISSPQPPGPKLSLAKRREQQIQELFTELTAEAAQLKRTLWLVLRTIGKETLTVDQLDMSPLWELKFTTEPGEQTKLTLNAQLMPPPTDDQLSELAALLLGSDKTIKDFREQVGLKDYHAGYLQSLLVKVVTWDDAKKLWTTPISPQPGTAPTHAAV